MHLILMRHGEADFLPNLLHNSLPGSDEVRVLTARGQQQAKSVAQQIITSYQPDLFVVSPLIRAQQTQQAFAQLCTDVPVLNYAGIKPEDDARIALQWISGLQAECIVVICHMNIIAYLAGLLCSESPRSFELAEARVYEQPAIGLGFSNQINHYVPQCCVP